MLVDEAVPLVTSVLPPATPAQRERRLKAALETYVRWGLTSIHDAGVDSDEIALYKALLAREELPVRAYLMAHGTGPTLRACLQTGPEIDLGSGRLTIRSFKVYLDGALGSRGAQLSEPYADAPNERGLELMTDAALRDLVSAAGTRGFQVNAHAIGDLAVSRAIDAFAAVGDRARRFRVEHASMVADADLNRLASHSIIASLQPGFVGEYSRWAADRVGPLRVSSVLRTADLTRAGVTVAAGSDYPAADRGEPVATLYSMVTRRGARGLLTEGWQPEQGVSVTEALRAMTSAPAYAAFQEVKLGALSPGRYADLTVLSADPTSTPPDQLAKLEVLMTIVNGRVVYAAP
jgi:predicted amidohydrolase YtcJ